VAISVIVTVCNRFKNFTKMVDTLSRQDYTGDVEFVVVDFYSDDGDVFGVTKNSPFSFHFKQIERPFNRSVGLNAGFGLSTADKVLFIDADLLFPKNFVSLVDSKVRAGQAFFPIVRMLNQDGKPEVLAKWGYGVCGITRKDFEKTGKWDETRKEWGREDAWFFKATQKSGIKVVRDVVDGYFHQYHPRTKEFLNKYA